MIYVLAGFGFNYAWTIDRKKLIIGPLVLVFGLVGLLSARNYLMSSSAEHIKPIVETLSSSYKPGDKIYVYYGAQPAFTYYYRGKDDDWIRGIGSRGKPAEYLQQLDSVFSKQSRVWMVFSHCFEDECELIQNHTSQSRSSQLVTEDTGAWLYLAD